MTIIHKFVAIPSLACFLAGCGYTPTVDIDYEGQQIGNNAEKRRLKS